MRWNRIIFIILAAMPLAAPFANARDPGENTDVHETPTPTENTLDELGRRFESILDEDMNEWNRAHYDKELPSYQSGFPLTTGLTERRIEKYKKKARTFMKNRDFRNRSWIAKNRNDLQKTLASSEFQTLPELIDFQIRFGKPDSPEARDLWNKLQNYFRFLREGELYYSLYQPMHSFSGNWRWTHGILTGFAGLASLINQTTNLENERVKLWSQNQNAGTETAIQNLDQQFGSGFYRGMVTYLALVGAFKLWRIYQSVIANLNGQSLQKEFATATKGLVDKFHALGYPNVDSLSTIFILRDKLLGKPNYSENIDLSTSTLEASIQRRSFLKTSILFLQAELELRIKKLDSFLISIDPAFLASTGGSEARSKALKEKNALETFVSKMKEISAQLLFLDPESETFREGKSIEAITFKMHESINKLEKDLVSAIPKDLDIDPAGFDSLSHVRSEYLESLSKIPETARKSEGLTQMDPVSHEILSSFKSDQHVPADVLEKIKTLKDHGEAKKIPVVIKTESRLVGTGTKSFTEYNISFSNPALGTILGLHGFTDSSNQSLNHTLRVCEDALHKVIKFSH